MRVTYAGSPGSRIDQPEDAWLVGDCPGCGLEEVDFSCSEVWPGETILATCWGGDEPHDVEIVVPDGA